jgi:hypothetical protein
MTGGQNTIRTLLVYSLVLPIALVLGYLLATSGTGSYLDMSSWAPLVVVLGVIALPMLLQWHHALLVLSLNTSLMLFFLPGSPPVWFLLTALSLTLSVMQRALDREMRFVKAPSIVWPLVVLAVIVYLTGYFTGGFGSRAFGSGQYGGRRYWFIFVGIAAFFAIIARPIPQEKAMHYVSLFLLGGIVNIMSNVIPFLPREFYWLTTIFPVSNNDLGWLAFQSSFSLGIARFLGLTAACFSVFYYMLARYGIRGMLSAAKFWRFAILVTVVVLGMLGGFRLSIVSMGLVFALVFYFEGLLRTRYTVIFFSVLVLGGIVLIPLAHRLPLSIQRTLTVFPLDLDPVARYEAEGSSEWRLEMWSIVLPEVPRYLFVPKGMGIDGLDMDLTGDLVSRGLAKSQDVAILAGDYHNGPLSILIPFGIWGFTGWLWFLAAATRALWLNYRYGPGPLRRINTLLLAYFIGNTIVFFFIFGGFFSELIMFTSVAGLSLSLNNGICKPVAEPAARALGPIEVEGEPALPQSV